jgi:diaminopimelate decarboxylase
VFHLYNKHPNHHLSANAGVLLTKVDLLKPTSHRNFAIIDAAMNDLIFTNEVTCFTDCSNEIPSFFFSI